MIIATLCEYYARDDNLIRAQVVKSARPKGKLCRHKIKKNADETD